MIIAKRSWFLCASTILLFLAGIVVATRPRMEPSDQASGKNDAMARPWMVPEAALPAGFPAPGPVGDVIIKTYPPHRLARANARGEANGMFMRLFRHIERNEISMTAPVVMDWPEATAPDEKATASTHTATTPDSMAFLYAKETLGTTGPDPADPLIVVEDVPETVFVSIGLRGGYGEATMIRGVDRLQAWLTAHPEWKAAGPPRSLAYNSPFVPSFIKYCEVQIPVVPAP